MFRLRGSLWDLVCAKLRVLPSNYLCIGCIEQAINRRLDCHDFDCLTINLGSDRRSDRLNDRLKGFKDIYSIASTRAYKEISE